MIDLASNAIRGTPTRLEITAFADQKGGGKGRKEKGKLAGHEMFDRNFGKKGPQGGRGKRFRIKCR